MTNTEKKHRIDELKIEVFLEKFIATLGACQRYSPTSLMVRENTKSLYALLSELKAEMGEVGLSEFHNNLMLNDEILSVDFQKTILAGAFIFFMLEYNFRAIRFSDESSLEDLERFLVLMATEADEIRENPEDLLRKNSIFHIAIEPYGVLESGVSFGAVDQQLKEVEQVKIEPSPVNPDLLKPSVVTEPEALQPSKKKPPRVKSRKIPERNTQPVESSDKTPSSVSTRIMSRPQPTSKKGTKKRPTTPTGPPSAKANTVDFKVFIRVGGEPIEGAEVTILSDPKVTDITTIKQGARFLLFPGNYKIRIAYGALSVVKRVVLTDDSNNVQMEINLSDHPD